MGVVITSSHSTVTSPSPLALNSTSFPLSASTAMSGNSTSSSRAAVNTTASSTTMTSTVMTSLCQNGSVPLCPCVSPTAGNQTRGMLSEEGSLDALLYIVVVLLFYAFSIVVLMVKYIRRENKEAYLRQYFEEYVARDHFQSAQARNQICLKTIMDKHLDPDLREHIKLDMNTQDKQNKVVQNDPDQSVLFSIPEIISEHLEDDDEVE